MSNLSMLNYYLYVRLQTDTKYTYTFVDIFLGSSQNWTSFRGYFYVVQGLFLR